MGNEGDHVKLVTLTLFVRTLPAKPKMQNKRQGAGGKLCNCMDPDRL